MDDTSPSLSRVHTNPSNTSPISRQHSNHPNPQAFPEPISTNSSYFSTQQPSTSISSRSSQKSFLDPTSGNFKASGGFDSNNILRTSRQNSDEENRYAQRKIFEGTDSGFSMQPGRPSFNNNNNIPGYTSSTASRSGSIPPSRGDPEYTLNSVRPRGDMANNQYLRNNTSNTSTIPHRPNFSAPAPPYSISTSNSRQKHAGQLSPTQLNRLMGDFDKLSMGQENQQPGPAGQRDGSNGSSLQFANGFPQDFVPNGNDAWNSRDYGGYQVLQEQSSAGSGSASAMSQPSNHRAMALTSRYSHSPSNSDARHSHHHSPFYSNAGTPPPYQQRGSARGGYNNNVSSAVLDRRLRGLQQVQQEQQGYMVPPPNFVQFRTQYQPLNQYELYSRSALPMNQLHSYYPMPPAPNLLTASNVPRGPARDHDIDQSQLMREFKDTMNKPSKRINELKVSSSGEERCAPTD